MKINFLYNSGFIIELENNIIVVDSMHENIPENPSNKEVYYLVSHSHPDHYNSYVLDKDNVILSDDIKAEKQNNITFVKPYDDVSIKDVKIHTFGSTDRGVSFLIKVEDKLIFHSGDLNWWHWKNDTKENQKQEGRDYKDEIKKLKAFLDGKSLDIAFVPVDSRLEENCTLAINRFMRDIDSKYYIPMHFFSDYSYLTHLEKSIKNNPKKNIIKIENKRQKFDLD